MEIVRESTIIDGDDRYEITLRLYDGIDYKIVTVDVHGWEVVAEESVDADQDPIVRFEEIVAQSLEMIVNGD